MARNSARIEFVSGDECRLIAEVMDEQFRFSADDECADPIWIDFDDVDQLVSFMLATKG